MKLYQNLEATEDNIRDTYESDLLSRKDSVIQFAEFLKSPYCPTSIAVNGEWGSGKTFFVKQTAYQLSTLEDASDKCLTVYYDAWENDNECDPIISIVDCIARVAGEEDGKHIGELVFGIAEATLDNPLFRGIKAFRDWQKENEAESDFGYNKTAPTNTQIKNKLKALFDEIINEHGERLILFVDELDRCKPDFAVRVLERLKHYFTIDDRVKIVFSVNINQLEHTIRHFYGDDFDSHRYLDRFFDMKINIPKADLEKFCSYVDQNMHSTEYGSFFYYLVDMIEYFKMSLREINKYLSIMNDMFETNHLGAPTIISERTKQCILYILAPIICASEITSPNVYQRLINGSGSDIIRDIGNKICFIPEFSDLWKEGESSIKKNRDEIFVSATDKCVELYEAVFMFPAGEQTINVGKYTIKIDTKRIIFKALASIR